MPLDLQQRKEISEQFAKGKMDLVERYLADDIRWNIVGSGTISGRDQVLEVNEMAQLQRFPTITIKNIVGEGSFVVVESTGEARTKSGKPYNQAYCEVFRFSSDELKEVTTYLDTALSAEALS